MGRKRGSTEIKYDCSICIGSGVSQDVMTADLDQLPRIEPEKWRTCYHKILTVMTIIKWKSDFESDKHRAALWSCLSSCVKWEIDNGTVVDIDIAGDENFVDSG